MRSGFVARAVVYLPDDVMMRWALGTGGADRCRKSIEGVAATAMWQRLLVALIPKFFSDAVRRVLAAMYDDDNASTG